MRPDGKSLVEIPYVAVDVETTGLSPSDGHRVCEIALLRFLRGTVVDSLVSFVNVITSYSIHYTKLYDPPRFREGMWWQCMCVHCRD